MGPLNSLLPEALTWQLGWTLVHFIWQGAFIAAGTATVFAALRGRSAQARYVAGCAGLLIMLATFVATLALVPPASPTAAAAGSGREPAWVSDAGHGRFEPGSGASGSGSPPVAGQNFQSVNSGRGLSDGAAVAMKHLLASGERLLPWLVFAWLAGLTVLSLRLTGGWFQLRSIRRRWVEPAGEELLRAANRLAHRLNIRRHVAIFVSPASESPWTLGWLRPVVLIPSVALTGLTPGQLSALLAHELAHVRRYDYLANIVQNLIETLLFYHPAVWWLSRRVRMEREHCCDDLAVAACGDRVGYARALTEMEALRGSPAWALAASGGDLADRVRRLVGGSVPRQGRAAGWAAGLLALVAGAGCLAGARPSPEQKATAEFRATAVAPEALVGTWFFDNPEGDDEQMSIWPDGRVTVLYSNGHLDETRLAGGSIVLREYDDLKTSLQRMPDDRLVQTSERARGLAKVWQRIDPAPQAALLRPLTAPTETEPRASVELAPWVVEGKVTDAAGQPMTGVEVRAACGEGTLRTTGRTTSDRNGRYRLRFGPGMHFTDGPGSPGHAGLQAATIYAASPGFAEQNLCRQGDLMMAGRKPGSDELAGLDPERVVLPNQPYRLDFVMAPAADVRGRLVDADGKPIADRPLYLDGKELPPSSSVLAATKTDAEGRFLFESVPARDWWFETTASGKDVKSTSLAFRSGTRHEVELTLQDPANQPGESRLQARLLQAQSAPASRTPADQPGGADAGRPGEMIITAEDGQVSLRRGSDTLKASRITITQSTQPARR